MKSSDFGVLLLVLLAGSSSPFAFARQISMLDLERLVDDLGDEILTHKNLGSGSRHKPTYVNTAAHDVTPDDIDEEDDEDVFADEVPHPVGVMNWGSHLELGQVSGVSVNPDDEPVVFHRGKVVWDEKTFDQNNVLVSRTPVDEDAIVVLDPDTAKIKSSFGSNMFYMPHGITVDSMGNIFVTDVGLHQVMRFPAGETKPDLILGESFVPGSDTTHFCKPTKVAVADSGTFFVADGYCNSRILKYNRDGKLLKIISGDWNVVHSLAFFEDEDVLCLSDREGQRIDCIKAGTKASRTADRDDTGERVITYTGVGRTYAIAAKGTAILSVSGYPQVRGITIDTAAEVPKILDVWGTEEGLGTPHDLAISLTGDSVYVADIDSRQKTKLHKFEVVRSADFI